MTIRRQKAFVGLLIVGIGALAVDRVFLRAPQTASAEAPASLRAPSSPVAAAPGQPQPANPATAPLSERLRQMQAADQPRLAKLRDIFTLTASFAAQPAQDAAAKVDPIEQFRRSHRVTATLLNGQRSQAMVDGRFVTLGQSVDGFRLVSMNAQSATFESTDGQAVLPVATESAKPGR